jgi:signal transduction histidine kinase
VWYYYEVSREKLYAWPVVIAIGVIFILSNAVWLVPFVRDVEQSAVRYQAEVARRIAFRADFFLEKKLREMGGLALDILESGTDTKKTDPIIAKFLARHPDFVVASLVPTTSDDGEYVVSPVMQMGGRKVVRITAPLPYTDLSLDTVVTIGDVIAEMAAERVGAIGRLYAVDAEGTIVFHEYEGVTHIDREGDRAFMAENGGFGIYVNEAGDDVLGVALPAGGIGWTIVAEDPLSEAWANKYNAIALAVILMVMGVIFVIILIINFKKIMAIAVREEALHKAKSDYISLLAHQLRTPLTGTKWNIKTLLDGDWGKLNEKQRRFLSRSYETNEQMIKLVNDLLNITRIEEGRYDFAPRKTDIVELITHVTDSFRDEARQAGIKLTVKKPRTKTRIPSVFLDAEKIEMALGNLIDNAIRYNKPKGTVHVTFAREVHVVRIIVKDTGVGIPTRQKAQLFSRFFRGDNVVKMQVQGFGLGLYIVKNIIERHGGTITVESKENEGAVFTITLPLR